MCVMMMMMEVKIHALPSLILHDCPTKIPYWTIYAKDTCIRRLSARRSIISGIKNRSAVSDGTNSKN